MPFVRQGSGWRVLFEFRHRVPAVGAAMLSPVAVRPRPWVRNFCGASPLSARTEESRGLRPRGLRQCRTPTSSKSARRRRESSCALKAVIDFFAATHRFNRLEGQLFATPVRPNARPNAWSMDACRVGRIANFYLRCPHRRGSRAARQLSYLSMCHDPSQSWDGGFALRFSMRLSSAIDGPSPGVASSDALSAPIASSQRRSR